MASKFKKGDNVKLISGIKEHHNYDGIYFLDYMKFSVGTVRSVRELPMITILTIEENPSGYSSAMLEVIK